MPEVQSRLCLTEWGKVNYYFADTRFPPHPASTTTIILFLHGLGGSGRYWFSHLTKLAAQAGAILAIAPDLLGFGGSDKPELDYTPELQLAVIQAVIQDCAKGTDFDKVEFYIVGHSMGGVLALGLVAQILRGAFEVIPQINGLVLLGTPYPTSQHNMRQEAMRSLFTRAMLSHPIVCEVTHHSLKLLWSPLLFLLNRRILKTKLPIPIIADYMEHTCQSFVSNANHIIFETDLEPIVQQISASNIPATWLIYSRTDNEIPLKQGQQLHQQLADSNLLVLDNVSHTMLGEINLPFILDKMTQ